MKTKSILTKAQKTLLKKMEEGEFIYLYDKPLQYTLGKFGRVLRWEMVNNLIDLGYIKTTDKVNPRWNEFELVSKPSNTTTKQEFYVIKNNKCQYFVRTNYGSFQIIIDDVKGIGIYMQLDECPNTLIKQYRHIKVEKAIEYLFKKEILLTVK
jgi:hypothetical protein